jgi:adenine-specific DNA-methyltransferase
MYFSPENAGRIDYFRHEIESWKNNELINEDEYCYLIASLIESISLVSNTAGVYGAFLKHWDPRAKKRIVLKPVESSTKESLGTNFINCKVEDVITKVECDILYLDPPYTQNQYGTQYHILQTLLLNDNPTISSITGSRPTGPMRSDWSKDFKAHILFDELISKTKARYIVFSYSPDGFMSRSFIEASLKRYGKEETYTCKKITYGKYKNFKSTGKKDHFEYLFYIEKKDQTDIKYESPLNYIGSKAKMINNLERFYPKTQKNFVDIFGGGFNVGINSKSEEVIYNELNHFVANLISSFKVNDTYQYILFIKKNIRKFALEKENAISYHKIRSYYNSLPLNKRDPRLLYTIILYGYNQQIRFNSRYDFNNPVGMRWFNDKVLEKMISFSRVLREKNIQIQNQNFFDLLDSIDQEHFVYMDPPYRLTTGSYNDGKRGFENWDIESERKMFEFANKLTEKSIRFMLSYVSEHKGQINGELKKWVGNNGYKLVEVEQIPGIRRKEVLVMNYDDSKFFSKKQISKERQFV